MNDPINLDPIEPTTIGPGLAAIPLTPTVWDDAEDWQHAVTSNGMVWQRRRGLWWPSPWWQGSDAEEIKAVCANPDDWAYSNGWPRKMVEDAHGPLEPITLPGDGYPHNDDRCRQDSVDAAGFADICRGIARVATAEGVSEWGGGLVELVEHLIERARSTQEDPR